MKALLVIDVQFDFLPGGSLEVPKGDQVIPVINDLMEKFDLVVATQDWHPEDHGSFASNHEGKEPGDKIELEGLEQILWPDHCVQGTHGAEFADELNTSRFEKVFRKGTDPKIDSYSGFYDNGHKKSTGLADYLRDNGVDEVYVTGLAADVCVKFTALDALKEDFKTYVVRDATRAVNEDIEKTMEELEEKGAHIIKSTEV